MKRCAYPRPTFLTQLSIFCMKKTTVWTSDKCQNKKLKTLNDITKGHLSCNNSPRFIPLKIVFHIEKHI